MTLCVGLDLSLSATGVALASGDLRTLTSKPGPTDSVRDRAERIIDLAERITGCVYPDVSLIVIEGPAYAQQAQAGVHLRAGLWWQVAANLTFAGHGDRTIEVAPNVLKKFATGRGNATKADMRMAFYQRAGIDCRDDNQVDAWWLRMLGLHLLDAPDRMPLPASHIAALTKLRAALDGWVL